MHFVLDWFMKLLLNSTELNSTSETKPCYIRATVKPAWHGNSTTGLSLAFVSIIVGARK